MAGEATSPAPALEGPGRPKTQTNLKKAKKETTERKDSIEEILGKIDAELCHRKEEEVLKGLFGSLKTRLVGDLLTTVQRVEERVSKGWNPPPHQIRGVSSTYAAALRANTTQTKPVPLRDLREIRVQRANLTPEEAGKPSDEVLRDINNKFANLGIGRILGARQMPSGDLVLLADSSDTKIRAEARKAEWLEVASTKAELRRKRYTVLVHGVSVADFDNQRQTDGKKRIYDQNPAIKGQVEILDTHWRKRILRLKKTISSLLVGVSSPEGANVLIREGLVLEGELKEVELFDPQCLATNATTARDTGTTLRGFKGQEAKLRCVNCTGRHMSGDRRCPKQAEEADRVTQAREVRPQYFATPKEGIPPPVTVQYFDTIQTTGKRQAEEPPNMEEGFQVTTRKPRGRPRQPLATPSDGRLGDFFTQTLSQGSAQASQGSQDQSNAVKQHEPDTQGVVDAEMQDNTPL
ncbi:hypothetical protein CNMCM6106_004755 [Aspergillus hiratsukae]|uniref:Uncharacterized protein n=1 Tax=Aspergillus hiratsukae TaxID=1194566 RepID=A0A8H6QBG6_9EURO|nr:hypothetical protein CNMCM6106_004755 [Aspergillus hiratsukae]